MMDIDERKGCPIGVFDSGVGGISVLRELIKVMPCENYIYLGDSKNAPYGTKSLETVRKLSFANAGKLLDQGAKGLVIQISNNGYLGYFQTFSPSSFSVY